MQQPNALLYEIAGGFYGELLGLGVQLDNDVIVQAPGFTTPQFTNTTFADVYVETGAFTLGGFAIITAPVWGPTSLNMQSTGRIKYPSGAGAAVANLLLTGGVVLNNTAAACSHSNASPDVLSCGISLTPAHLDAGQGAAGFGRLGVHSRRCGASITNGSL